MKFEKFIGTFFILNIILLIAVAFASKNELILKSFEDFSHTKAYKAEFLSKSPENFQNDPKALLENTYKDIFENTDITSEELNRLKPLHPHEQAKRIVKLFSQMGDGVCLTGKSISEKINLAKEKKGCSEDYAQIFNVLSNYISLKSRIVRNSTSYANEIYYLKQWVFIDPYYAMSAFDKNSQDISYFSLADKILNNGWVKFDFFGGEDHCMSGKPMENHPYYGDKAQFSHIYTQLKNNTIESLNADNAASGKIKAMAILLPYHNGKSEWAKISLGMNNTDLINKYTLASILIWIVVFIATNILLPLWFLISMIKSRR